MIINQSVGFTFIHIPKSAGTSVTQFLSRLNGPLDLEIGGTVFGEEIQRAYAQRYKLRKHSTLADAQSTIAMARPPQDMFLFTFVRHPYARLSSIFSFLRKWEAYNPDLLRTMKSFSNFEEFVASGIFMHRPGPDNMFRPQCDWLKVNGALAENVKCFHIEDGVTAIESIREELVKRGADAKLLPETFPHANRSESQPMEKLGLSEEIIGRVNDFYAEDFEAFGYE
ncbi:sulfotransferase family 2 domain-containing protein [Roseicyclus mahoneyensis]|uniref:Sulfotransferase family protein n=1 Tax=Roseicyclus mahoneyensis TaxID=164332 RepID=A0A316GEI2_9RHOB|nr:sulfotransferase family 2 domain-containing protein [Roseicyclus mahoneyensis]PWK59102.1 sulfotransferase family protein [Roseicyclus mahoneyensis]